MSWLIKKIGRKGMVLILTFIIITALTAIVVVFLYLTSTQTKVSGYDTVSNKALWLAEAGIQKAIYYLKYGDLTGGITSGITESLGDGSYTIVVTQPVSGSGNRTITSTGTCGGISRIIAQTVTVRQPYQSGYGVAVGIWEEQ